MSRTRRAILGLLLFGLSACATAGVPAGAPSTASSAQAAAIVARIPTKGMIFAVEANPRRNEILVGSEFGIYFVDAATHQVQRLSLNGTVGALAVSPDGQTIYALQPVAGRVVAVDAASKKTLWEAPAADYPANVGITPDGRLLYITQQLPGGALVVDTTTHESQRLGSEGVRFWPWRAAVSPDGKRVYFTSSGEIQVFDTSTQQEVARFASAMGELTFAPGGSELLVAHGDLTALQPVTGTEIWSLRSPERIGGLEITADGATAYTTLADEPAVGVIDLGKRRLCGRRLLPGPTQHYVLGPDGTRLYLGSSTDEVLVIDTQDLACRQAGM